MEHGDQFRTSAKIKEKLIEIHSILQDYAPPGNRRLSMCILEDHVSFLIGIGKKTALTR